MEPETFTGYIYQIYDHWDGLRYIGSTTKNIHERLKGHERHYKCHILGTLKCIYSSFKVLKNGDYDISLLEKNRKTECSSKIS